MKVATGIPAKKYGDKTENSYLTISVTAFRPSHSFHTSDMSHICNALPTVMSLSWCGREIPKQKHKEEEVRSEEQKENSDTKLNVRACAPTIKLCCYKNEIHLGFVGEVIINWWVQSYGTNLRAEFILPFIQTNPTMWKNFQNVLFVRQLTILSMRTKRAYEYEEYDGLILLATIFSIVLLCCYDILGSRNL